MPAQEIALTADKPLMIRLKPGQERRILGGHAWIFSNEIAQVEGKAEPGDLADVRAASGQSLGTAFYHPNSLIACRMLSSEPVQADQAFFQDRLARALSYRGKVKPGESAYRLCFGESDGIPGLVVDRYGDILVLQVLSAGVERRLGEVEAALKALLSPKGIYLKNDHRTRALEGLKAESRTLWGEVPPELEISEGGLRFLAPIGEGQKTGYYFDQSENRAFLRPYFRDRLVLDLYCYTGSFSINALKHGAKASLGIDSSGPSVALAKRNAQLNGLGAQADFEEGDAEEALLSFAEGTQPFKPDMILLDPPSLAPAKKDLPRALRHYVKLNSLALRALPEGGSLATSTCSHHVSRELFVEMLRAAAAKARRRVRLSALRAQGADHPVLLAMPETEYLHFAWLELA
ncbi:MAG: class I SAM-dependent rRNA methyltransferase [Elusimicrobia bacterium]|nr:class I SAM-dependent rRNA methyltransferase [Elusimicrobiota bacterium]